MAELRAIAFGPGDKLRWLEAVARDPRVSDFGARVAIAISNRVDKYTGAATVGQLWLAGFMGGTERGVRNACVNLEQTGHLRVDRFEAARPGAHGGGRGKSNILHPISPPVQNPEQPFRDKAREPGTAVPSSEPFSRNVTALNPERHGGKPGTAIPSLPKDYLNSSFDTRKSEASGDASWLAVKGRMRSRFGEAHCASWFDRLSLLQTSDGVARLLAPSNFIRDHISSQWTDALESAWKSVAPEDAVNRVIIIVEQQRAAE